MSATASQFTYPASYSPKAIPEQIAILRSVFSDIATVVDENQMRQPLPEGAEACFALPRWQRIAPTYGRAVEAVMRAIAKQRRFFNCRERQLGPEYLRQSERSVSFFEKLNAAQCDRDILVVPAQFGLRHQGHSPGRTRETFTPHEFGLGAFAVGIMILTHPERFPTQQDLCVNYCPGDEASPGADGYFTHTPFFRRNGDRVGFGFYWSYAAFDVSGSVSGFVSL